MVATNVYFKSFTTNIGWFPLADVPLMMNATIVAGSKNVDAVLLRFDGGDEAAMPPGATVQLEGIDLSRIEGNLNGSGRVLFVAGYTRS